MYNGREFIGDFVWSWMVNGFKGLRFAFSARYRHRVRRYWSDYPSRRSRGMRQMVIGGSLYIFLLICAVAVAVTGVLR